MKCFRGISVMVTILFLTYGNVHAGVIDFEGLGLTEGSFLTTIYNETDVTFNGAILIIPGNPYVGFNGNSSGSGPGGIDNANSGATISAPDGNGDTVCITFATPVGELSFYAADIEIGSLTETFTARVYDAEIGGNLLHSIVLTGGDPGTGDGLLSLLDFSAGFTGTDEIQRLEFEGSIWPASLRAGYAVDNLSFTAVPIPASIWLFGSGLLCLFRVRKKEFNR